jgi:hypothetical protein
MSSNFDDMMSNLRKMDKNLKNFRGQMMSKSPDRMDMQSRTSKNYYQAPQSQDGPSRNFLKRAAGKSQDASPSRAAKRLLLLNKTESAMSTTNHPTLASRGSHNPTFPASDADKAPSAISKSNASAGAYASFYTQH